MKISLIIPSYHTSKRVLSKCLQSVVDSRSSLNLIPIELEVIVVDSTEKPNKSLSEGWPIYVRFIYTMERLTCGDARNLAVSQALYENIAFLDSDCAWTETWLKEAVKLLGNLDESTIFTGPIWFEEKKNSYALALHIKEFHEFLSDFNRGSRFVPGGNSLMSKRLFEKIGGFNTNWQSCEDIGLLQKLNKLNKISIMYRRELSIVHQAHLLDESEINTKVRKMGYWRAHYDKELNEPFCLQRKRFFFLIKPLLSLALLFVVLKRSVLQRSAYLGQTFLLVPKIFWLCRLWADGFINSYNKKPKAS